MYDTIRRANTFLIAWGTLFLTATLVLSILSAFGVVDWQAAAVTGGLSLAQFVGAFFTQPSSDLQRNLTNLAVFKMVLESHSLKTAVARFHLTTPQALRELHTNSMRTPPRARSRRCGSELEAIEDVNRADFEALRRLGFSTDARTAPQADQPTGTAATDGNWPSPPPTARPSRKARPGEGAHPRTELLAGSALPTRRSRNSRAG